MRNSHRLLLVPAAFCAVSTQLPAAPSQTVDAPPKVEAATIKPAQPGQRGFSILPEPGGRLRARNLTLKRMLLAAYHLHDSQLAGGPEWLDRDAFDIDAKAEGGATLSEAKLMAMLGSLISERFHLQTHRETRPLSIYALVVAKTGPKLKPAEKPETTGIRNRRVIETKGGGMADLADVLGWVMGRPVRDETGLSGLYGYRLEWTPDESQIQAELTDNPAPAAPAGESIFVAIQEQLGLKLEARKAPMELLVIDRAEKPAGN